MNAEHKICWLVAENGTPAERVVNIDEMVLRMVPTTDYGWSETNHKCKQMVGAQSVVRCNNHHVFSASCWLMWILQLHATFVPRIRYDPILQFGGLPELKRQSCVCCNGSLQS